MPNWCENILKVEGPAKEIARFKKKARGKGPNPAPGDKVRPLSLHSFVPQPKKYTTPDAGDGWYNWRLAHWGTKWDVDSQILSETQEKLEYGFDSAWSPPVEWLTQVGPQFPELSFRLWYAEGGSYFAGVYTVEGGESSTEEKDYVEAQIEERGSYQVCCGYCDDEMEILDKNAVRICEQCLKFRCDNCGNHQDAHMEDEKCPFDSTTFKNISSEKIP